MIGNGQQDYLTFGSIPLIKNIRTIGPDGNMSCEIYGSIRNNTDKELSCKDTVNVKFGLIWTNDKNQEQDIYLKFGFMFQDMLNIISVIKSSASNINQSLQSEYNQNSLVIEFPDLIYTRMECVFFAGKVLIKLMDVFDHNKLINFHISASAFKRLFTSMEFFYNKYIDIHNFMFSKYAAHYNFLYLDKLTKQFSRYMDTNQLFFDKFDIVIDKLTKAAVYLNKIVGDINFSSVNKIISKEEKKIDEKEKNIPEEIKSKTILLEDKVFDENNDISGTEIEPNITLDQNTSSDDNLINEFDTFLDQNEDLLKSKRPDFLQTTPEEIVNEEIKEQLENFQKVKEESSSESVLPIDLFGKYKTVDVLRTDIKLTPVLSNTYEDMITNILSKINAEYIVEKYLKNNFNFELFNKYMTLVIKVYSKRGIISGFLNESDPLFFLSLDDNSWSKDKRFYKVMSFIFINLVYLNEVKNILVSKQVDPVSGIKDDRQTSTYFKLLLGSLFFTYFYHNDFNTDLLFEYINNDISKYETYFTVDLVVKNLQLFNPDMSKFYNAQFYIDSLSKFIDIRTHIRNQFGNKWQDFFIGQVTSKYSVKQDVLIACGNDDISNIEEYIKKAVNIKPIILRFIEQNAYQLKDYSKIISLIDLISTSYKDMAQYPDFHKVKWEELPEELLKAIIVYKPTADIRMATDFNYFVQLVENCPYNKNECLQLLNSLKGEQNMNNSLGNQFVNSI